MEKAKLVYLVKQHQPSSDYFGDVIYIFDNEDDAIMITRRLNKEYGEGIQFSKEWDVFDEGFIDYSEHIHCYTYEAMEVSNHEYALEVMKQYDGE